MGKLNAHIDANTGQVIAVKGTHYNVHIDRVKRRVLDPNLISIVDRWLDNFATITKM